MPQEGTPYLRMPGAEGQGADRHAEMMVARLPSDELEQLARSTCRPKTMLTKEVQVTTSTPPSTSVATPTKSIAGRRRRESEQRDSHTIGNCLQHVPANWTD
jgi:hypothetical protein